MASGHFVTFGDAIHDHNEICCMCITNKRCFMYFNSWRYLKVQLNPNGAINSN